MKRLLVLSAVAVVTAAVGCASQQPACNPCAPAAPLYAAPAQSQCAPAYAAPQFAPGQVTMPAPETYAPIQQ